MKAGDHVYWMNMAGKDIEDTVQRVRILEWYEDTELFAFSGPHSRCKSARILSGGESKTVLKADLFDIYNDAVAQRSEYIDLELARLTELRRRMSYELRDTSEKDLTNPV